LPRDVVLSGANNVRFKGTLPP